MNGIKSIVHIISTDGGDFAYFTDKEDLYTKLSGIKDTEGNNMEFIEIESIEEIEYNGEVIDLSVEDDESYNIESIIVHNSACTTFPVTGSL